MRLIDADKLKEKVESMKAEIMADNYMDVIYRERECQYLELLKKLIDGTENAEPEKGKWISRKVETGDATYDGESVYRDGVVCSVCGEEASWWVEESAYCPHCGAKMDI